MTKNRATARCLLAVIAARLVFVPTSCSFTVPKVG